MDYLWFLVLPALAGGIVQGMSGFGCGIVVMLFLPTLFSVQQSSAMMQAASVILCLSMVYTYRKHVNWKLCIKPWIFYFPIFYVALTFANSLDTSFLKPILGLFLVCVAVYCICFAEKIHIRPTLGSAFVCAGISATVDAFFGIGGPPMVVYFLGTTKKKEEYLGSIQLFFWGSCLVATVLRITKGQITLHTLPSLGLLIVAVLIGKMIGGLFVKRINQALMKKVVYAFVGMAGLITFITNISALHL